MLSPDYAQFKLEGREVIPGERMKKKLQAIPFPDFNGKTVLDVGCDYGQFSFYAASKGASVTGLDRNRNVKGVGQTDLVALNNSNAKISTLDAVFHKIDLGKQWHEFGKFDHVLIMSSYHHVYQNCGDHRAVWFWLWNHCKESVIYEGPMDDKDKVIQMNVSKPYTKEDILNAAHIYFESEYIGPALHEPDRHVYIFHPKKNLKNEYCIALQDGMKGASKAFEYMEGRRIKEIANILGYTPIPGSLNCITHKHFTLDYHYYPSELLDVTERGRGLDVEWSLRDVRFYPVKVNGVFKAHAMRFRGEKYPSNFIELISCLKLRDLNPKEIEICS